MRQYTRRIIKPFDKPHKMLGKTSMNCHICWWSSAIYPSLLFISINKSEMNVNFSSSDFSFLLCTVVEISYVEFVGTRALSTRRITLTLLPVYIAYLELALWLKWRSPVQFLCRYEKTASTIRRSVLVRLLNRHVLFECHLRSSLDETNRITN